MPICIRNTFIDTSAERSPSLERFLQTREVSTCPSSHIGRLRCLFAEPLELDDVCERAVPTPETRSVSAGSPSLAPSTPPALVLTLTDVLSPEFHGGYHECVSIIPPTTMHCDWAQAATLASSQLLLEPVQDLPPPPNRPALGTDELPSIGSAGHHTENCKPCAFFHTVGCENGLACQFCHLCDSEERKRRRKAKTDARKAERRAGRKEQ